MLDLLGRIIGDIWAVIQLGVVPILSAYVLVREVQDRRFKKVGFAHVSHLCERCGHHNLFLVSNPKGERECNKCGRSYIVTWSSNVVPADPADVGPEKFTDLWHRAQERNR